MSILLRLRGPLVATGLAVVLTSATLVGGVGNSDGRAGATALQRQAAGFNPGGTPRPDARRADGLLAPSLSPSPAASAALAATPGVSAGPLLAARPTLPPVHATSCTIAFGMYQHNAPWSWGEIDLIEAQINRHSSIVHWYAQWGNQSGSFNPTVLNLLNATRAHGSTPMITWEPWNTYPITNNPYPLSQIASGGFDSYIDSWASGMAAYAHPVLIAFAQEMNGNWYPWGDNVNGNTPAAYIAAARHIHDRFALKGARNAQWVFDPDADMSGSFPSLQLFYPGDGYVDWLGVDVYNSGTTQSWSSWQGLAPLLRLAYYRLGALNATKRMMLVEFASVEQGGSKAQWILNAGQALTAQFPRVRAAVWFSEDNSQLALNSSSGALGAARAAFGAAPYCATLPY